MSKARFSLVPYYTFPGITDLTTDFLINHDIKFLILDLDNTIAAYDEHGFSSDILNWINEMMNSDIKLFIISNSSRINRVKAFSESIDVKYITKAQKPSPKNILHAMEINGFNSAVTAFAGDQIFTDTLAANRAGIISILVRPKRFTNPFLALRYYIEIPFRLMCKNKIKGRKYE